MRKDIQKRNYENKLINESTPFAITEAFKMLRTNMFYLSKNETCPVFAITSAYAHAGKSIIITNVALSFAQLGKRVLLIDGDMRCPVLHKLFKSEEGQGLSEVLAGVAEDEWKTVCHISDTVDLMTSGRIPPNPSELLSSEKMRSFLAAAREKYDFIFIDLPPICEVSDAGVIADCVTGYLFAVRAGVTDQRAVSEGLDALKQMNASVAGLVLNDVDIKSASYGKYGKHGKYGKYSKYGYTRGYGQEHKK